MSRRFKTNLDQIRLELENTFERLGAIEFDYLTHGGMKRNSEVSVAFVLEGEDGIKREYQYKCDQFTDYRDNLRAIQQSLQAIWRMNEDYHVYAYGGDKKMGLLAHLQGFRVPISASKLLALPAPATDPWVILDISRDATEDEIARAHRILVQKNHPDLGGSTEEMQRINQARDEMIDMRR